MANKSGNAYALTILCPILARSIAGRNRAVKPTPPFSRDQLQTLHVNEAEPDGEGS